VQNGQAGPKYDRKKYTWAKSGRLGTVPGKKPSHKGTKSQRKAFLNGAPAYANVKYRRDSERGPGA